MNRQKLKKYLTPEICGGLIKIILYESGKDFQLEEQEKVYISRLVKFLDYPSDRLGKIKEIVRKELANYKGEKIPLNLKLFFRKAAILLLKYHSEGEVSNLLRVFVAELKCEQDFSLDEVDILIGDLKGRVKKEQKPKTGDMSFDIQSDMDEDCKELLTEVSEKDWEQAIEDYREVVIDRKAHEDLDEIFEKRKDEGMQKGALIGGVAGALLGVFMPVDLFLLFGGLSIVILLVALFVRFKEQGLGAGVIGSMVILTFFRTFTEPNGIIEVILSHMFGMFCGAPFLAFIGAMVSKRMHQKKLKEELGGRLDLAKAQYYDYVLSPQDLLLFWEARVEGYLHDKKRTVKQKIKEASKAKGKCINLIEEIKELSQTPDTKNINRLKEEIGKMDKVVQDAEKVNIVLQRLEDRFASRIHELRIMVNRQKKLEQDEYRREELGGKIARVLGQTKEVAEEWQKEKQDLQVKISGMVDAFQDQLLHTKDFVEAEMQLSEYRTAQDDGKLLN